MLVRNLLVVFAALLSAVAQSAHAIYVKIEANPKQQAVLEGDTVKINFMVESSKMRLTEVDIRGDLKDNQHNNPAHAHLGGYNAHVSDPKKHNTVTFTAKVPGEFLFTISGAYYDFAELQRYEDKDVVAVTVIEDPVLAAERADARKRAKWLKKRQKDARECIKESGEKSLRDCMVARGHSF